MTRIPVGKPARARCPSCDRRLTRTEAGRGLCDRCRLAALTAPSPLESFLHELTATLAGEVPASFALDGGRLDPQPAESDRFDFAGSGSFSIRKR